jgi:hypothetical protein
MLVAVADVGGAGTGTPPAGLGEALHPRLGIDRCLLYPCKKLAFLAPSGVIRLSESVEWH